MRRATRAAAIALLGTAVACKSKESDTSTDRDVDLGQPAAPLVLPDVSGVDKEAAILEAVDIVLSIRGAEVWAGHQRAMERAFDGCPDPFVGAPESSPLDEDDDARAQGMSWSDFCESPGGLYFRGWQHWITSYATTGSADDAGGRTVQGSRTLMGSGVSGDPAEIRYEMRGEISDSVYVVQAGDYQRFTWSTSSVATVSGTDILAPVGSATPGGYRADAYVSVQGGDAQRVEVRGDVYLFEHRIQDRFDSLSVNLSFVGELGAGPEDCTLEPRGWIGVRDANAWWLDVVFQPAADDDATNGGIDDPDYTACDGCGTVYLRGVEQTVEIGEICPDLSALWANPRLAPPDPDLYIYAPRTLSEE
jgi:hypothetical protein